MNQQAQQPCKPAQIDLFYRAHRQIADGNETFMELVRDGMTREDLRDCIERRPSHWKRFEGFLKTLPSRADVAPAAASD